MMANTHVIFGVTCWATYERVIGINVLSSPETLLIAAFSSLLPDIDHPHSRFGRIIPFISYPLSAIFGHRGITHSLFIVIAMVVSLIAYGSQSWFLAPLVVGYISHLVGDMLTNSGVPLFWPKKAKVSFPIFNTGSLVEPLFRLAFIALFIAMLIQSLQFPLKNAFF